MAKVTNGDNIIQKIDYSVITKNFVNLFYASWMTDLNNLLQSKILCKYSSIKYEGKTFKGGDFYKLLLSYQMGDKFVINILKLDFIDSGSRRIDISVFGKITKGHIEKHFSQTFILCNNKNIWFIKNSILIII